MIVDNTQSDLRSKNARFLKKLVTYVQERRPYDNLILVSTLKDFKKHEMQADFIILSGSRSDIPDLNMSDERYSIGKRIVERTCQLSNDKNHMHEQSIAPVLGICFGAQLINKILGGTLKKLPDFLCKMRQVHGVDHSTSKANVQFCLNFLPNRLSPRLRGTTIMANQPFKENIVAFEHPDCPLTGTLFHPEAHSSTHYILDEFFKNGKISTSVVSN